MAYGSAVRTLSAAKNKPGSAPLFAARSTNLPYPERTLPKAVALGLALSLLTSASLPTPAYPVLDLHVDLSYQYNFKARGFAADDGQFSLAALQRGGVSALVLPLFVPRSASAEGPRLLDLERSYQRTNDALLHTPPFVAAGCSAAPGTVRTFFAFEGAGPLADDPDALALWASRGLRIVGLVHTQANQLASSSGDREPKAFGLTERGRVLVERAFAFGLSVDVSHASDRALRDVIEIAARTHGVVVATHSNARALANHPRNLTDAQIRSIAQSGGVVGVNFHGPFLARTRAARLSDVVAQLRHLVHVAGVEHVAIGSDFEGDIRPPPELSDASRYPRLGAALEHEGFEPAAIRKIFAENAWRVLCGSAPFALRGASSP